MIPLKPTKFKIFNKKIFGFDVETTGKQNKFYCVSIVGENYSKIFFKKEDFITEIMKKRFWGCFLCATNLGFDFFAIFRNTIHEKNFKLLFNGSDLMFAKTYISKKELQQTTTKKKLTFIDTLNYAKLSVSSLGKILKIPKLNKPKCLGRLPKNTIEKQELITYNLRDSEISYKGIKFLFEAFNRLGANPKMTISSTTMSLFKNKYLNNIYYTHEKDVLRWLFKGYYGGRTEVFQRGKIENYNYYDVNSLYPFVMKSFKYPNPNTMRIRRENTTDYIHEYEGFSEILINCPEMEYPFLPFRTEEKLIFPTGEFRGVYTHVEIKKALELGYTIKKVFKTIYFKETIEPFKEIITDLYNERLNYKKSKSPMEFVTKILMNSLYGKFGQKFDNRDNWTPIPDTQKEIDKLTITAIKDGYCRTKTDSKPACFCFPEWCSYVTAYARIHLYDLIKRSQPVYCDTDSIITKKKMLTGNKIGELKLEMKILRGIIVKPKFYYCKGTHNSYIKIKGVGTRIVYHDFLSILKNNNISYTKFVKFKESLARGITVNSIIDITKNFTIEDNKRIWKEKFDYKGFQSSTPVSISTETGGKTPKSVLKGKELSIPV